MASSMWILIVVATGFAASVDSLMGWLMVSVLALGPSAVLFHFTRETAQTTSQIIHAARR